MPAALKMSEEQLTDAVVDLATVCGWMVMHPRPARTSKGWRTPTQGHKGFPDITLAKNGVVLFRELKSDAGRMSPEQKQWREHMGGGDTYSWGGVYVPRFDLWKSKDWHNRLIETTLKGPQQ